MSAFQSHSEKGGLSPSFKKLGIIAGGGSLPGKVARACDEKGIEVFIIAFKGQTPKDLYEPRPHLLTSLGKAGKIVKALRQNDISDLVFIGSIHRPKFSELSPDLYTASFLAKVGLKSVLGDDSLLKAIRGQLEKDGFTFHGAQDFIEGLFIAEGPLGRIAPDEAQIKDIRYGFQISRQHGQRDLGQSVIVKKGETIGVEDAKGTNALIKRCTGSCGILVKTCKPQQDKQLDLPTIGPETVKAAADSGLQGIAVQAGHVFVLDRDEVISLADASGLFVYGIGE